jgi:2-dehydropantoate 2-reductase
MQVTIVGAGALGTILGAHLGAAGHDVTVVARGQRAKDIRVGGLRVRGLVELDQHCRVVEPDRASVETDLLIYAVKTYHMADATAALSKASPQAVFSVANGVLKNEQLAAVHGEAAVLGCMANFSGELLDSGVVEFTRNVRLAIGTRDGATRPDAGPIARVIDDAGIHTESVANIESVEWSKFVGWVALFSLSLMARTATGIYLENPRFAALGVRLIREVAQIAGARHIELIDQSPVPVAAIASGAERQAIERLRAIGRDLSVSAPDHRMSSLQDLQAGRPLEVEETLGYAVAEAARLDVAAPVLGVCYEYCSGLNTLQR